MRRILLSSLFCLALQSLCAQSMHSNEINQIKLLRASSNEAIANHNVDALAKFWLDDIVLIRGNSTHLTGKDLAISAWQQLFRENRKVLYVRTPSEIVISNNDTLAWETGSWEAQNSYSNGGNYSAMWKKEQNEWKIQAELFVALF